MLSQIQLEELSYDELKDLVRASELTIPKHASKEDLVDLMVSHYATAQAALLDKAQEPITVPDAPIVAPPTVEASTTTAVVEGKYAGYNTRQEYLNAMLKPVLCIITPQSPEFSRQTSSTAAVSVGNDLIPNMEIPFVADGSTVVSVPRIAIKRIKSMKLLMRGNQKLDKAKMKGNLQGSGFGTRFRVHELSAEEVEAYRAERKATVSAASGVGL